MVTIVDSWENIEPFKSAHEEVGVRARALGSHCTTFHLEVVLIVETKVVQVED